MIPESIRSVVASPSPGPLYMRLKDALLHNLREGTWDEDRPLPSERELTTGLRISRATVRQAMQELESEGWLIRRQGHGTYPNTGKVEQQSGFLAGFSETMRANGLEPSSRILDAALVTAEPDVASALAILPGAAVARIRRLRSVNGEPLLLESSHLDAAQVPGIVEADLSGSLYDTLRDTYRIVLTSGEETFEARLADADTARALAIKEGDPVLYTERTVRTDKGVTIEFTRRFARADKASFRVRLSGSDTQINWKDTACDG